MRKKFSRLWIVCGCLICLGLISATALGQEPAAEEKPVVQENFPGVSEVVPRSTAVGEEIVQSQKKLAELADISELKAALETLRKEQERINQLGAEIKADPNPHYDKLLFFRNQVASQSKKLEELSATVGSRLTELDSISQKWHKKKEFWGKWEKNLREKYPQSSTESFPEATARAFQETEKTLDSILKKIQNTFEPLLTLQTKLSSLGELNHAHTLWLDAKSSELRENLFSKNAPSFKNTEFYIQFGPSLWTEFLQGYRSLGSLEDKYFEGQGWVIILHALFGFVLIGFILKKREIIRNVGEWDFVGSHPVAAAVFISFIPFGFFYAGAPSLLRLLIAIVWVTSIAFIISSILKDRRKIFLIFLLAFVLVLTLFLQTISFPQPLFRIYRAFLCLLGIPFLWRLSKSKAHPLEEKSPLLSWLVHASWLFKVGAGVLAVALIAEMAGYIAFSSWILQSSISTVFILFFTAIAIRLGEGTVVFVAGKIHFQPRSFLDQLQQQLAVRVKFLVRLVPMVYSGLYLIKMWFGSQSIGSVWNRLMGFRISLGTIDLSVSMVLMAVLVIYLSLVASWALGLFFDKEVFPKKTLSRGVKDLVKKLVHYTLILIGFLMAMGALGLELQNFAVLAGALGIGIGFGLQNIVNNFVSGLILLFERPITVGDVIVFQGDWGTVVRIGLRSTVVETYDRSEVIVPNSQLVSEAVVNWTLSSSASRIILPVGVAYGTDIGKVLDILESVAADNSYVLADPAPYAIFTGFGDSSLAFELRVYVADINFRLTVKTDLGKAIDLRFKEEGIAIPFPQRDLHLRSVDARAGDILWGRSNSRQASLSAGWEDFASGKSAEAEIQDKDNPATSSVEDVEGAGD